MKVYVARQPILNEFYAVVGYELLHRSNSDNRFDSSIDGELATRRLITNAVGEFGLKKLLDGRPAYVNCTRSFLLSDFPFLMNPRDFVLEILETVEFDPPLLERLWQLQKSHFTLALDDYVGSGVPDEVLECVEIIKVDFKLTDQPTRRRIAQKYAHRKKLLAEKVETITELRQAQRDGYTLFQGYYFSQPIMMEKNSAEVAQATCMRVWREIEKPTFSYDVLYSIIRSDVNLAYKFLLKINTLQYYRSHRVGSLRHALVRMGVREIRRWVLLVLLRSITDEKKGEEAAKIALSRGVFAERLAKKMGLLDLSESAYATGLFSMLDVIVDQDIQTILRELALPLVVEEALLYKRGVLAEILEFIVRYEFGDWDEVDAFIKRFDLEPKRISVLYVESVAESDLAFHEERIHINF